MVLNTKQIVTITEANQNFSKVARMVDKQRSIIIMKNNKPKYVVVEFDAFIKVMNHDSESLEEISERVLFQNLEAFRELAK